MGTKNSEVEVNGQKDKGLADLTMATRRSPRRVHLLHELTFINLFTVSNIPPTPPTPPTLTFFKLSLRSGNDYHETTTATRSITSTAQRAFTKRTNWTNKRSPSQAKPTYETNANNTTTAAPKQKETTFIKFSQLIMLPLSIPHPSIHPDLHLPHPSSLERRTLKRKKEEEAADRPSVVCC